jgi:hypothetical protein
MSSKVGVGLKVSRKRWERRLGVSASAGTAEWRETHVAEGEPRGPVLDGKNSCFGKWSDSASMLYGTQSLLTGIARRVGSLVAATPGEEIR